MGFVPGEGGAGAARAAGSPHPRDAPGAPHSLGLQTLGLTVRRCASSACSSLFLCVAITPLLSSEVSWLRMSPGGSGVHQHQPPIGEPRHLHDKRSLRRHGTQQRAWPDGSPQQHPERHSHHGLPATSIFHTF